MIGMHFAGFLLIISLIAALIVHYAIRYHYLEGFDGFLVKWIIAWIAAWVASPVLGHWFERVKIANVYIIPAFIGGFIGAFVCAAMWKANAVVVRSKTGEAQESQQVA
jgi:uncharacterized membrane protein YeaQ/YmgE (transglycosylase-associated protein family)